MSRHMLAIAPICVACCAQASLAQTPSVSEASGSGGDITRPLQRFDLRAEVADAEGDQELTVTLRHDRPVPLGGGWQANLRMDLPLKFADEESRGRCAGKCAPLLGVDGGRILILQEPPHPCLSSRSREDERRLLRTEV